MTEVRKIRGEGGTTRREADNRDLFFSTSDDPAALARLHRRVERLLGIPPSLASADLIIPRLAQTVARARQFDPALVLEFDAIDDWIAAYGKVPRDHEFARLEILIGVGGGLRGPEPALGKNKQKYPLWRVLFREHLKIDDPVATQRRDAYQDLKSLLVCCHIRAQFGFCDPNWPDRIYNVALLMLDLGEAEYLAQLDQWNRPPSISYKRLFFTGRYHFGPNALRHRFGLFADLILRAYKLPELQLVASRDARDRLPGTRVRKKRAKHDLIFEGFSTPVRLLAGAVPMPGEQKPVEAEFEGPGQKEIDEIIAGGACYDEFLTPQEFDVDADDLLDEGGAADGKLPPLASLFAAARGRLRATTMRAQAFVTRRGRPRLLVVGRILTSLEACATASRAAGDASGTTPRQADVRETARLAAVCLVTGASAEVAARLVAFETVASLPAEWELAYAPAYQVWLRPYLPPDRHPLTEQVISRRLDVLPRIARSDCWSVGDALGLPRRGRWFHHSPQRYREIFGASIRPTLIARGVPPEWADLDIISGLLGAWFDGLEEGEALRNDALFGTASSESKTQRHYVALDRRKLDAYCFQAMAELWNFLKLYGLVATGKLFAMRQKRAEIPETLTGNDWAPKAPEVCELVRRLREAILAGNAANDFVHHNRIVAYVGLGVSVAMAFRDVCTPITDLNLIDPETGFAPIQEKDFADGVHARIVWVPTLVRQVVNDYLAYLNGLWSKILTIPTGLTVKPTKARDRHMFGNQTFDLSLRSTLFFFEERDDGGWEAVEFTGLRLKRFLDGVYPAWTIPNAGRHLTATFGFNWGEGGGGFATIFRAILAHWSHGQSAWAPFSGFDPYRYRDAVKPVIESLLEEIGFETVAF